MSELLSSGPFVDLPTEILTDIFLRLPVRSLLFCMCTCKPFRNIIKHPNFAAAHLDIVTSTTSDHSTSILSVSNVFGKHNYQFFVSIDNKKNNANHVISSKYDHVPFPIDGNLLIIGSCNGLVCACVNFEENCTELMEIGRKKALVLLLWNPVTRQIRYLPPPDVYQPEYWRSKVMEFGYVPETNDYRVLRAHFELFTCRMVIEVYKTSTNSWTTHYFKDYFNALGRRETSVFVNGSFHWTLTASLIVSFNLKDEKLGKMDNVVDEERDDQSGRVPDLAVMHDSLALIYKGIDDDGIEIWVMSHYGVHDSWVLLYHLRDLIPSDCGRRISYLTNGILVIGESTHDTYIRDPYRYEYDTSDDDYDNYMYKNAHYYDDDDYDDDGDSDECRDEDQDHEPSTSGPGIILYDIKTREMNKIPSLKEKCLLNFYSYVETLVFV